MQEIFGWLARAIEGSAAVALLAAGLWGIASILLSPCHLASIPLIVAYVHGQGPVTGRRALTLSSLFAAGILVTIAIVGLATAMAGRILGDTGPVASYFVAAVLLLVGLGLLGVIPLSFGSPTAPRWAFRGPVGALLLGLTFGLALGPCTFAYMAAILGVAFRAAAERPVYATALLGAYAVGHCAVIAIAGASMGAVQKYLNWAQGSRVSDIVKGVCAVLVIAGGLWLVYTA